MCNCKESILCAHLFSEIEDPAIVNKLLANEKENFKILAEKVRLSSQASAVQSGVVLSLELTVATKKNPKRFNIIYLLVDLLHLGDILF